MTDIYDINKKKYLKNNKKSLLLKEIIVLIIFASLIAVSILFLFPVVTENIFFINTGENTDLSDFYYGKNNQEAFDKSSLETLNSAERGSFSNIDKITAGKNYLEIFSSAVISA